LPNFACHLAVGSVTSAVAVAYADALYGLGNAGATLAFLAGVSGGLLPDLDSDNSKPLRLSGSVAGLGAAAAMVGFATVPGGFGGRPWPGLYVGLLAFASFLLFNTLVVELLRRKTVHRGLFHSLSVPFLYAGIWALFVAGQGRKTVLAVWALAVLGTLTHLVLDACKSLSFNPLKVRSKDIEASTRLWIATALVNFLALLSPLAPLG
jgi:membrane-bound metal-dependent hydrolase YbcI (DUF457 family)